TGQTASDADGNCLYPDDMASQTDHVLANIGSILPQGAMDFSHVVRSNIYTTDIQKLVNCHDHVVARLRSLGCRHAGTLLGVSGLASPGAMIEIEVTAAA